jgi:DNA-binding XRE family transcriptional regulator
LDLFSCSYLLPIVCRLLVIKVVSCWPTMKTDSLDSFGKSVRKLRETQGLSQEQLAELADLHRTYVGAIERGERNVSLRNIVKLSRALRVTPAQLLEDTQ